MRRRKAPGKPKKVTYELIGHDTVIGHPMYALLGELVGKHHQDLAKARIALAWCTSWRPNVDGQVILGKLKKAGDLDREVAAFDFIVLLNRFFWTHPETTDAWRRALLDHELCHGSVKYDDRGEPVEDERGRLVYRTRKHDLEEFNAVVERHGLWKRDLETFAAALKRTEVPAFEPCESCQEMNGWIPITDEGGYRRVKRCPCWDVWAAKKRDEAVAV